MPSAFKLVFAVLMMTLPWWFSSEISAATQANLAISAVVVKSCRLVVHLINNEVAVENMCSLSGDNFQRTSAVVETDGQARNQVTVTY